MEEHLNLHTNKWKSQKISQKTISTDSKEPQKAQVNKNRWKKLKNINNSQSETTFARPHCPPSSNNGTSWPETSIGLVCL